MYHYHTSTGPPFLLGCYGPVQSVDECKALYDGEMGCLDGTTDLLQAEDPFSEVTTVAVDTVRLLHLLPVLLTLLTLAFTKLPHS